jgi:hypothetical protein
MQPLVSDDSRIVIGGDRPPWLLERQSHGATRQHENTMIGGTKSANFEQTIPNPHFINTQM